MRVQQEGTKQRYNNARIGICGPHAVTDNNINIVGFSRNRMQDHGTLHSRLVS